MNPNGPYPGRQLFIGLTNDGKPALAYLVTGRSPPSRERKAVLTEDGKGVIIGPIGDQQYDPLRHYTAVKTDNETGLAVVSNGIQTEAILETYKLLYNVESIGIPDYMDKLLNGAGAEPDSYHTPRIAGVITDGLPKIFDSVNLIGIVNYDEVSSLTAKSFIIEPELGTLRGISTYEGNMDNPEVFKPKYSSDLPELKFSGRTPEELAEYLYGISEATYQGDDIRVCSIGGIRSDEAGKWDLAIKNRAE